MNRAKHDKIKMTMNDQDFKKIFVAHKVDVPDNGFSKRVTQQLPERKNILPQMIIVLS